MFSHAITLEILNQTQSDEMVDYISLAKLANEPGMDSVIAAEVKRPRKHIALTWETIRDSVISNIRWLVQKQTKL